MRIVLHIHRAETARARIQEGFLQRGGHHGHSLIRCESEPSWALLRLLLLYLARAAPLGLSVPARHRQSGRG